MGDSEAHETDLTLTHLNAERPQRSRRPERHPNIIARIYQICFPDHRMAIYGLPPPEVFVTKGTSTRIDRASHCVGSARRITTIYRLPLPDPHLGTAIAFCSCSEHPVSRTKVNTHTKLSGRRHRAQVWQSSRPFCGSLGHILRSCKQA